MKACWFFSKTFPVSTEILMWFMSLTLCVILDLLFCVCWTILAYLWSNQVNPRLWSL
jgi:ABC-type transport system involved in multi-copper enzyme maturation permease subunit